MKPQIPSLNQARENARSKMQEGYAKMSKLIEDGAVNPIYPENPEMDAATVAASTPDKTVTVNSELLRDLLNWSRGADPAAIDNVVAKAEEIGVAGPLGPEKLIDLTGSAEYQQPGQVQTDPKIPGTEVPAVGSQHTPGMPVASGEMGPLSPVMSSFLRRGKKVQEEKEKGKEKNKDIKADNVDAENEVITNPDQMKKPTGTGGTTGLPLGDKKNKGNTGVLEDNTIEDNSLLGVDKGDIVPGTSNKYIYNNGEMNPDANGENPETRAQTPRWTPEKKVKENDIIPNTMHEPILNPAEMGKKNPGVKPDGGQTPKGMPLNDPMNKENLKGMPEDAIDGDSMHAAELASELDAEGSADEVGAEVAPGGEDISIGSGEDIEAVGPEVVDAAADAVGAVADLGAEVAPEAPKGGLVQQISSLEARIAELEAMINGGEVAPAEPEFGGGDEVGVEPVDAPVVDDSEEDELEGGEDAEEDAEEIADIAGDEVESGSEEAGEGKEDSAEEEKEEGEEESSEEEKEEKEEK